MGAVITREDTKMLTRSGNPAYAGKLTLLIIIALILTIGCSKEPIEVDKLVYRNRIAYEINSDKPFSGKAIGYYDNGQKEEERTYKDGVKDGTWIRWYGNGQKWIEGTYKGGGISGKWIRWYGNGQKNSEITYNYEKLISSRCWDRDGNEINCPEWYITSPFDGIEKRILVPNW
ncbi:MAG: putative antitoxin YwqK [Candidatus Scalindua rubra]|uniref:Putative antitoxin YwqK n=1 Tax=Candidatus Scalindua rubra TaxID=1872076 RepID=A0A1E3X338_9BACT|nr:MAG: putative antitoxin YwqK [Candidatus Scalindua rubra]